MAGQNSPVFVESLKPTGHWSFYGAESVEADDVLLKLASDYGG